MSKALKTQKKPHKIMELLRSATLDSPKALGILIVYLFIVAMDKKQEHFVSSERAASL